MPLNWVPGNDFAVQRKKLAAQQTSVIAVLITYYIVFERTTL